MFSTKFSDLYGGDGAMAGGESVRTLNSSIELAGTMLSILPTVILYLVLQKQFVESVERSGITGE